MTLELLDLVLTSFSLQTSETIVIVPFIRIYYKVEIVLEKGEALPVSTPAVPKTSIPLINIPLNPPHCRYCTFTPRSLVSSYERTGSTRSKAVSRVRRCATAQRQRMRQYVYSTDTYIHIYIQLRRDGVK